MTTTSTETLTEALARHGYSHEPDPTRAIYEVGRRVIVNPDGAEVGPFRSRSGWALVHALDREAALADPQPDVG